MMVNSGRSIPDLRDGLKPVQRRVIQSILNIAGGNRTKFIKSARVVGECMGKYHPHGDNSIYDAAITMSKDWGQRVPLIKPQGNNGSIAGDNPAAMRYTEMKLAGVLTLDKTILEQSGLPKYPTYDDSGVANGLLNLGFPYILFNGAMGIGVAISTYIPSFNPAEVIRGCRYIVRKQIENKTPTIKGLAKFIKGPDFPTKGNVSSPNWLGIMETGRGKITHEVNLSYVDKVLTITSIPTKTTSTKLIESIHDIAKELTIVNIEDLSDMNGTDIRLTYKGNVRDNDVNTLYVRTLCRVSKAVRLTVCSSKGVVNMNVLDILTEWLEFNFICELNILLNHERALVKDINACENSIFVYNNIDVITDIMLESKDEYEAIDKLIEKLEVDEYRAKYITLTLLKNISKLAYIKTKEKKRTLVSKLKNLRTYITDTDKLKLRLISDLEVDFFGYKRLSKLVPYVNRKVIRTDNLMMYLTPDSISSTHNFKAIDVKGNNVKVPASGSIVILTSDGILYRIPAVNITNDPRSPVTYIEPRDMGVRVIFVGVFSLGGLLSVKHGSDKIDAFTYTLENTFGTGVRGKKIFTFNKKLGKVRIKKLNYLPLSWK